MMGTWAPATELDLQAVIVWKEVWKTRRPLRCAGQDST